jgi:hypothetical protein
MISLVFRLCNTLLSARVRVGELRDFVLELTEDESPDPTLPRGLSFADDSVEVVQVGGVKANQYAGPLTLDGGFLHGDMVSMDIYFVK